MERTRCRVRAGVPGSQQAPGVEPRCRERPGSRGERLRSLLAPGRQRQRQGAVPRGAGVSRDSRSRSRRRWKRKEGRASGAGGRGEAGLSRLGGEAEKEPARPEKAKAPPPGGASRTCKPLELEPQEVPTPSQPTARVLKGWRAHQSFRSQQGVRT